MSAPENAPSVKRFLETVAGERCPCGHLHRRHRKPDPSFRVEALVEVRGACWDCECRGEVALAEGPES